jgi:enoyl-CoA hydratase/carnithine racemase
LTQTPNVRIERVGAVLCVTFDRPDKKNALNRAMYLAATQALRDAGGDPSIGAVVFAGSGGVFTAGNDIADFLEASGEPGEFPAFTFIKTLAACETPLVAAIEGMAIGIGATMMLHCDLVYVAPDATFRLPFVDLGLVPEAASSLLLPRRIGMAKASEFLLLGEAFGAGEAVRHGLANAIVSAYESATLSIYEHYHHEFEHLCCSHWVMADFRRRRHDRGYLGARFRRIRIDEPDYSDVHGSIEQQQANANMESGFYCVNKRHIIDNQFDDSFLVNIKPPQHEDQSRISKKCKSKK